MKINFEEMPLQVKEQEHRFVLEHEGSAAFISYVEENGVLKLTHTEAPPQLQGTGAAGALVEKTLDYARQHGFKVWPVCPYIAHFIRKNPEWKAVVSQDFPDFEVL